MGHTVARIAILCTISRNDCRVLRKKLITEKMRRYKDRESARVELLRGIVSRNKVHLGVLLFAHAELRAVRDPVIPSSLPSTASPELRMEIEEDLHEAIEKVRKIESTEKRVGVEHRGRYTLFSRDGIEEKLLSSVVEKTRNKTSISEGDFNYAIWASLLRYRVLGLLNTNSAAIPNSLYLRMANAWPHGPVIEGFASLFNSSLPDYYGLFPDMEGSFGCISNFFSLKDEHISPGSLLICNPPYQLEILNAFIDKTMEILSGSQSVCVLVVLPAFEVSDRENLNFYGSCDEKYPSDYTTDVNSSKLKVSPYNRFCALYCKESFPFWNMNEDKNMGITSALVLLLANDEGLNISDLVNVLPQGKRISCTRGVRAAKTEVPLQMNKGFEQVKAANPWD